MSEETNWPEILSRITAISNQSSALLSELHRLEHDRQSLLQRAKEPESPKPGDKFKYEVIFDVLSQLPQPVSLEQLMRAVQLKRIFGSVKDARYNTSSGLVYLRKIKKVRQLPSGAWEIILKEGK